MVIFIVNKHTQTHWWTRKKRFDTMTKWYVNPNVRHKPTNCSKAKKRITCTIKLKVSTLHHCNYIFWEKRDHKNNWDYLKRLPQELGLKISDILGACQILRCLTPCSKTLRFLILYKRFSDIGRFDPHRKMLRSWFSGIKFLDILRFDRPK